MQLEHIRSLGENHRVDTFSVFFSYSKMHVMVIVLIDPVRLALIDATTRLEPSIFLYS